jgi:uncharacterized protein (DUF58 family)
LLYLGLGLVLLAGTAAALAGVWWAAAADLLIALGIVAASLRAQRRLRIEEAHLRNAVGTGDNGSTERVRW